MALDNITGPDPAEDDPTPRERTMRATIKLKRGTEVSNRNADSACSQAWEDLTHLLLANGWEVNDIDINLE